MNNYLMHYGTPKHSGRYPYGSGDRPYQHDPIKRYQNEDGSLTKIGLKYFRKNRKDTIYDRPSLFKKETTLKKGTSLYRIADANEPIDNRLKYFTITDEDREFFKEAPYENTYVKDNATLAEKNIYRN